MEYNLLTPKEISKTLADRLKKIRLLKKWKRTTLSERSGVSVASLIRFEQTAQISLDNFLNLMSALGRLDETLNLLLPPVAGSIEELEKQEIKTPKRGLI
ncbi:MAG: helix-turn-helix transcriptional regulator [Spirochaetia bacterium]|jgi:transcriptional regulator with XRE-family HTH domain|nr:helix-turn-helix transcriptional regulator [Spirochaetia bacterium]